MTPPLVIVGASYAGIQLAASARELGFEEDIVIVGDEPHPPYQRPPLSKGLLAGKITADQLGLRGPDFFRDQRIDLRLGTRATGLDTADRRLTLADGTRLDYGWLALATGARCRPLPVPGAELQGVHQLRTLDDALAVAAALGGAPRACVVGGGFIGLEVASAMAATGAHVTVVEAHERLLARSFPPGMSDYIAAAHRRAGVALALGRSVRRLHGDGGRVRSVELDDGQRIDCELVVLGIGVLPNSELAQQAGIACADGIPVDTLGRTAVPGLLAAGDVAAMALPPVTGLPPRMRLESIQAANDGARAAASVLVGQPRPLTAVPWFWSDQGAHKLQIAGLSASADAAVMRGEGNAFSVFRFRDGRLSAVESVNRAGDHMIARRLLSAGTPLTPDQAADPALDLKALAMGRG